MLHDVRVFRDKVPYLQALPLRVRIEDSVDSFGVSVSSLAGRVPSNLSSVFDFLSDLSDVLLSALLFAAATS